MQCISYHILYSYYKIQLLMHDNYKHLAAIVNKLQLAILMYIIATITSKGGSRGVIGVR